MKKTGTTWEFVTTLKARGPGGAWTYLQIPFNVETEFGSKARVPVAGTLNGAPFRSSLMPEGDGTHSMVVSKDLQAGAKARAGDRVTVAIHVDTAERIVTVPAELQQALGADAKAAAVFAELAYSHKKEYADWIGGAKRPETKAARVAKTIELLKSGAKRLG